jgi:hypothetical protein
LLSFRLSFLSFLSLSLFLSPLVAFLCFLFPFDLDVSHFLSAAADNTKKKKGGKNGVIGHPKNAQLALLLLLDVEAVNIGVQGRVHAQELSGKCKKQFRCISLILPTLSTLTGKHAVLAANLITAMII